MTLLKTFTVIWVIWLFGCSDKPDTSHPKTDSSGNGMVNTCFIYPGSVDSLNVRVLFDSAKWAVYTWNCDKLYRPKIDSNSKAFKSFGMLSLKFDTLKKKADTIEFYFGYFDGNKTVFAFDLDPYVYLESGVGYNMKTGEKLYMISSNNYNIKEKGKISRFANSLQSDVIRYIDSNWNKLDSCFRILAEQRGLNSRESRGKNK